MAISVPGRYSRVKFQSRKLETTLLCNSLLVRDYLIHLEWDDDVHSYQLKPFKLTYKFNGKQINFHPQLVVNRLNTSRVVTWLKFSIEDQEKHSHLVKILTDACADQGFHFAVKLQKEIRQEPLISNLKFLRRYICTEVTVNQITLCHSFFTQFPAPLFGDLINFFNARGECAIPAYTLLSNKILRADLSSQSIDRNLPIFLSQNLPEFKNGRFQS